MTTFAIVDESTTEDPSYGGSLTRPVLEEIAAACEEQLNLDVAPEWGGNYLVRVASTTGHVSADEVLVRIVNSLKETAPGAAAYHDRDEHGHAIIYAARDEFTSFTQGEAPLSEGLGHEFCETAGDAPACLWADRMDGTGEEEALELCDRLQGSRYTKNGVVVPNFLRRRAFFPDATGSFDFLGVLNNRLDKTSEGYVILRTAGTDEHDAMHAPGFGRTRHGIYVVRGRGKVPARYHHKRHPSSRTFRRGIRITF